MLKFLEQKLVPALYYMYILSVFVSIALVNILGLLVFTLIIGLRIYRYYKFKEEFVPKTPLNNIILLIFMVEVLSILTSPFLSTAIKPWWWYVIKNRQILLFFLHLIVLSYYVDYKNVLKFILYVSPIFAVLALYDSISGSYVLKLHFVNNFHWPPSIIGGAYKNYIEYSFIHNMITLSIIPFIFLSKNKKHKIMLSILAIFELTCVLFSGSRSGILSIISGITFELFAFYLLKLKYWKHLLSTLGLILVILSVTINTVPILHSRFIQTKTNINQFGDVFRFNLWKINLAMFKDHPILGVGNFINADADLLLSYCKKTNASTVIIPSIMAEKTKYNAHNTYIQFLSGTGLTGFSLFLTFMSLVFYLLIRLLKENKNKEEYPTIIALAGIIGIISAMTLTDIVFFKLIFDNFVTLAIALLAYFYKKKTSIT